MKIAVLFAFSLILIPGLASGEGAGPKLDSVFEDLRSPFFEVRRRAVRRLGHLGAAAVPELLSRYSKADVRTRAHILDALRLGAPEAGLELVYVDLSTPDRGVVHAQRRLVSAVYAQTRDFVIDEVAPLLTEDRWKTEERLRMLPGPAKDSREELAALRKSEDRWLRRLGRRLEVLVARVDGIRARMAEIRSEGDPRRAERAREIERRLLRHDTERAMFAVYEAGGRNGSYRGLYAGVKGLLGANRTPGLNAVSVLISIVRDEPLPEAGIPAEEERHYPFLEPPPMSATTDSLRILAADCLCDVGDARTGAELAEYYTTLPLSRKVARTNLALDEEDVVTLAVAEAACTLGDRAPLTGWLEWFDNWTEYPWGAYYKLPRVAQVCSRLGRHAEAVDKYGLLLDEFPSARTAIAYYNFACALSKKGEVEAAVDNLREAHNLGYTSDPEQLVWMQRDTDLAAARATDAFRKLMAEVREQEKRERR